MNFRSTFLRRLFRVPELLLEKTLIQLPSFHFVRNTIDTQTPIKFRDWFRQEVMGINRGPYWPVHPSSKVVQWKNVLAGVETSPGYMPGCYIQAIGSVEIGDYTQIGPNVSIISANHRLEDLREHSVEGVSIGRYCWLGAGSIVLPGVKLGDFTIVGAGTVVTKSFTDGYVMIVGNPARKVRDIDPTSCEMHRSASEYHGFIRKAEFNEFRLRNMNI